MVTKKSYNDYWIQRIINDEWKKRTRKEIIKRRHFHILQCNVHCILHYILSLNYWIILKFLSILKYTLRKCSSILQHLSTSRIFIKSMCTWQIFKLDFLEGKVTKENIYSALSNYFSTEDNLLLNSTVPIFTLLLRKYLM